MNVDECEEYIYIYRDRCADARIMCRSSKIKFTEPTPTGFAPSALSRARGGARMDANIRSRSTRDSGRESR